ncbi:tRNA methyltransferase complex GCD14 subunit, partial [Rhizodiscina lignyota]
SPFLHPPTLTTSGSLALLHLRRDLITPTILSSDKDAICNTRFGNYPHSTLLGLPWGSQVLASKLLQDRQRQKNKKSKKRKRDDAEDGDQDNGRDTQGQDEEDDDGLVILGAAASGFTHILPPTPELWTQSLPHRTQVVYTPDYSYILQRLRARPGSVVIEAGAGSGSFTHAACRAVFNGYPGANGDETNGSGPTKERRKLGKVHSFEYHEPRANQLREELGVHGLENIVQVTHRDVYENGFNITSADDDAQTSIKSPEATAIFLDLPAPWLALRHLTRTPPPSSSTPSNSTPQVQADSQPDPQASSKPFVSPLSPVHSVHICTFSPCIEQVQRTVSTLRDLGWTDIDMVELAHRRIDVRRERVGYAEEGERHANPTAATVEEAVERLRNTKAAETATRTRLKDAEASGMIQRGQKGGGKEGVRTAKERRMAEMQEEREKRKAWKEGRLVSRTEGELKGHTSYLVFAVLPVQWDEEKEERARKR